jgi:transketolase
MREEFVRVARDIVDEDPRAAVLLADISDSAFAEHRDRHERIVNVGIRESLMVSMAGGFAMAGLLPIAHTYAPFLVERAFEQIKLDLGHQDVMAVLVSIGASYDAADSGRTHHAPGDVALMSSLPGWSIVVPGHADEVEALLRSAMSGGRTYIRLSTQSNDRPYPAAGDHLVVLRRGRLGTVVAVGPMASTVLQALAGIDVTIAITGRVRPFDRRELRELVGLPNVVVVEPYLEGSSASEIDQALLDTPHRTLSIGVPNVELRAYGTAAELGSLAGLDPASIRRRVEAFIG